MEEGEFKKRIKELWQNTATPNRCYDAIEVHAQKRVLLGEIELIIDEAEKEFPEAEDVRSSTDYEDYVDKIETWFKKWFGETSLETKTTKQK